jgi:hypothetical protein
MLRPKWHPLPPATGLAPLITTAAALLLYVLTAAPSLTWAHHGADGGDLIAAAMTGGVPHPSGYPTYCLVARLFALLPLGPVARRFSLFSACAAAAAVGLLCHTTQRLLERDTGGRSWRTAALALSTALVGATGPILWSQALIAEVNALNALFLALGLYLALHVPPRPGAAVLTGLTLGLGLGNHLTLALAMPGLAVLAWPRVPRHPWRLGVSLTAGLILGLAAYAYLPLAARYDPPVNWGDPQTWEGLRWVVTGRIYRPYIFGVPLASLPARLGAWAALWTGQLTWPGVMLALVGVTAWIEGGRRRAAVGTTLLVAAYSAYAIGYDTTDSYVYLIPAHLTAVLWMAQGAAVLIRSVEGLLAPRARWAPAILIAALALLPVLSAVRHAPALSLRHDREATAWLDDVTGRLPPGALLITLQDRHTFALAYAQWVEGRRHDITVVDADLLAYPWYRAQLERRYPTLVLPAGSPTAPVLAGANLLLRPVFLASARDDAMAQLAATPDGDLWRVTAVR